MANQCPTAQLLLTANILLNGQKWLLARQSDFVPVLVLLSALSVLYAWQLFSTWQTEHTLGKLGIACALRWNKLKISRVSLPSLMFYFQMEPVHNSLAKNKISCSQHTVLLWIRPCCLQYIQRDRKYLLILLYYHLFTLCSNETINNKKIKYVHISLLHFMMYLTLKCVLKAGMSQEKKRDTLHYVVHCTVIGLDVRLFVGGNNLNQWQWEKIPEKLNAILMLLHEWLVQL